MADLSVLFLGGSGVISSACSWRAVEQGLDLSVLNRGKSTSRPLPSEAHRLVADLDDPQSVKEAIGDRQYDAVVDWLAFTPEQVRTRTDLFRGRTGQYVFISSASAYQTPPARLPITESTPLRNPFWEYSRNKIACEELLTSLYRDEGYPVTVVRPSHTYDKTMVPFDGRWTAVERMRQGKEVVVHGDGTSLWTLTHHRDFARAFVPLLGHQRTLGEAFHITSDDVLTWDQIARALAVAARSLASCTCRPTPSRRPTRNGVPVSSVTRRTRWCSTTARCVASTAASWRPRRSNRVPVRSSRGTTRILVGEASMPGSTP
jgi:nucleoside-diphosphate-sugar epimerase